MIELKVNKFKDDKGSYWSIGQEVGGGVILLTEETSQEPKYGRFEFKHQAEFKLKEITKQRRIEELQALFSKDTETQCFYVKRGTGKYSFFTMSPDGGVLYLDEDINLLTGAELIRGVKTEIKVPSYISHPSTYLFDLFKVLQRPLNAKEI
jgi:hypothetical protein